MGVSQQAIADRIGLSRTTVTKILNRDPKYSASKATRDRVFQVAEEMGYDFTSIRRPFKREYGRTEVNVACEVTIYLENGELFDKGHATARNIGVGGALLVDIQLPRMALPLSRFSLHVRFLDIPELAGLNAECQVVRIADSQDANKPELGLRFINASDQDREILRAFIAARAEEARRKLQQEREEKKQDSADEAVDSALSTVGE